ncbi:MAG: CvpA family protein [Candidatus Eisenbacteria bacterium]
MLVVLVAFSISGILRGTFAQVFAFIGIALGLIAAAWVSHWVGLHWNGARPMIVFIALRWVVAALAGFAVAALFQWWGELVSKATHDGPFGWLDRLVGGVIGIALGVVFAAFLVLAVVQFPWLRPAREAAVKGMASRPLLDAGVRLSRAGDRVFPGGKWLHGQFVQAALRVGPARGNEPASLFR